MDRIIARSLLLLLALFPLTAAAQEDRASPVQAESLVKKAIAYYHSAGRDKALSQFADKNGKFIHKDLYVMVYDMQGNCLAQINEKMIGKNMLDLRDVDGKYLIRERLDRAQKEGKGWQDYKFFNPVSKKIEPKTTYFEKVDQLVFSAGAYKPLD